MTLDKSLPTSVVSSKSTNGFKGIGVFFGLIAVALVVTSVSGAALTWDGSYLLFKIQDQQAPFVDHSRWTSILLQLPTIIASHFSGDLWLLQTIFGLSYALVPLAGLAISWWFVRHIAPGLFNWAALGIGLVTLPGQVCFVSDASMALQLSWPVFLAILTGLPKWQIPAVLLLSVFILIVHPEAIGLLGIAAGLCLVMGLRYKSQRPYLWCWAGGFVLLDGIAVLKLVLLHTSYESDQLSLEVLQIQYNDAVNGLPLLFTALVWAVGLLSFISGFAARYQKRKLVLSLQVIEIMLLVVAGVVLIFWATDTHLWERAIDFRTWALFLSLPFIALALLDRWLNQSKSLDNHRDLDKQRLLSFRLIGLIFLLVLSVQSIAWVNLTNDLKSTVQQSSFACVAKDTIQLIKNTPLDHWSVTPYSILAGGEQYHRVVLANDGCGQAKLAQGLQVADWDWRTWGSGHLELKELSQQVVADQKSPPSCRVFMGSGWYDRETLSQNWWRWNSGSGSIEVFMPADGELVLGGLLETLQLPNRAAILVNGIKQNSVEITWIGFNTYIPITLPLKMGQNIIEIVSQNRAIQPPNDQKMLAIAVSNLKLTDKATGNQCSLQN